jgi:lethal(2) giant larvae protein
MNYNFFFSDDFIIFSGGMPRASYNDKNTVSIIQGTPESGKHHVLDFTSKVIDFLVIAPRNNETGLHLTNFY